MEVQWQQVGIFRNKDKKHINLGRRRPKTKICKLLKLILNNERRRININKTNKDIMIY
jgi:hypothetical protein